MSQSFSKIKSRIKSVSSAYKVTSAMKLVSTVKLKQWRNKMIANKEYMMMLQNTVDDLLNCEGEVKSPYLVANENTNKKLYIIVSSSLGLCGSYNNNIFKEADKSINKDDDLIVIGSKGMIHYPKDKYNVIKEYENFNINDSSVFHDLVCYVDEKYLSHEYKEVHIIYSEYKNSLVFVANDFQVLPLKDESNSSVRMAPIFEPNRQELANELVPFYVSGIIYSKLFESAVCEEGSRSNAMENATNNAKDILDDLKTEFNKARQTAITQEIIEIVSASKGI